MTPLVEDSPLVSALANYLREINHTPLLNAAEEKDLARRIRNGDTEARDQLIRANLRLVVAIAKSFRGCGVGLEDLIEEGNLGLIRAVEGFDPTKNTRFSTYAAYWIKQSMIGLIGSTPTLPLPSYVIQMLREWRRAGVALEADLQRQPTDEEIIARLNLPARKARIVAKALKVLASRHTGSDAADQAEPDLSATLATKAAGHESSVATSELIARAMILLDELDQREAAVLEMHFGLRGSEPTSLQQIGKRLHLTRERVRQIEGEALSKLHERMAPPTCEV